MSGLINKTPVDAKAENHGWQQVSRGGDVVLVESKTTAKIRCVQVFEAYKTFERADAEMQKRMHFRTVADSQSILVEKLSKYWRIVISLKWSAIPDL